MKRIAIVSGLIIAAILIIAATVTVPQDHDWNRIYNGVLGDNGDADTTSAWAIRKWEGVMTVVFETDTGTVDVSGTSDSCLTVYLQLYRLYKDPNDGTIDGDWMTYYNSSDEQKVKIDTVARSIVNDSSKVFYMNIPVAQSSTGEWAWADSARLILAIGVGDSLASCKVDVGGQ